MGDLLNVERKLENMSLLNRNNNRMTYNTYGSSGPTLLSKKTLGERSKVIRSNSGSRDNSQKRKKEE